MEDDKFVFGSAGLIHELEMAMARAGGWTPALVKKLSSGDALKEVREALLGRAEIRPIERLINCDADPFVPEGWEVEEHIKGGQFQWNPNGIKLYLSKKQQNGSIEGNKLRKELANEPVLNANILDYLLAHPELIPEEWKGKYIFFWGTIYRYSDGRLCVRCLYWSGDRWYWRGRWLGGDFSSGPSCRCLRKLVLWAKLLRSSEL